METNCHMRTVTLRSSIVSFVLVQSQILRCLSFYSASSLIQIPVPSCIFLPLTNPLLAQTLDSVALWNCLVTQRQLLPRANERGVRCPLNKLRMPPSKETCSAPVFVAAGSCLPGLSLKIFSCYHKISGKRLHVEGVRETLKARVLRMSQSQLKRNVY